MRSARILRCSCGSDKLPNALDHQHDNQTNAAMATSKADCPNRLTGVLRLESLLLGGIIMRILLIIVIAAYRPCTRIDHREDSTDQVRAIALEGVDR